MVEPSSKGAVKVTAADWAPAVADTAVGASGTVVGTTAADGSEGAPAPTALVAWTVNV